MPPLKKASLYLLISSLVELVAVGALSAGWDSGLPLLSVLLILIRWAVWLAAAVELLACFGESSSPRRLLVLFLFLVQAPYILMVVESRLLSVLGLGNQLGLLLAALVLVVANAVNLLITFAQENAEETQS